MKLWVLLVLISLVHAESTTTTSTTTTEATVEESSDIKGKRTPTDVSTPQNSEYGGHSDETQQRPHDVRAQISPSLPSNDQISYIFQKQPQFTYLHQIPPAPQVTYVPIQSLLGADNLAYFSGQKQSQLGGTTFTVQYAPASSVYRSAGNSQKYELVSKTQQLPNKPPNPFYQNSLLYLTPGQGYPYPYSVPQLQPQYVYPTGAHPQGSGGLFYSLQPVVMTFALPGAHPHNSPFATRAAPVYYPYVHPVPYPPQRQQVAYVHPPSAYTQPAGQRVYQQAVTPKAATSGSSSSASPAVQNVSPFHRVHSQSAPHFQQIKG